MILWTVDAGNTRAKLAVHRAAGSARPEFCAQLDSCALDDAGASLRALSDAHGIPERIGLSSVAEPARLEQLVEWLTPFGEPLVHPSAGIVNATLRPDEVGPDRLYAARAAVQLLGAPAIVVDAGTAITVDAVGRRDGEWAFLGGAIAAGARVTARALGELGARLFETAPEPGAPALGRTTEEALTAGIVHGQRGTVRELASAVASEAGLEEAPLIVTGGGRCFLGDPWLPRERWIEEPELVALGLVASTTDLPTPPDAPLWSRA